MKLTKITLCLSILFLIGISFYSCSDSSPEDDGGGIENPKEPDGKYAGFDFETVVEYQISLTTSNPQNEPLNGVYLEMYMNNPVDTAGVFVPDYKKSLFYKGLTNSNGAIECKLNPPSSIDSIYVLTYHAGLPRYNSFALQGENVNIAIGGSDNLKSSVKTAVKIDNIPNVDSDNGYYILGSWGKKGKPDYLESANDEITNDFLEMVNASLPEGNTLMNTHPEYLANGEDANLAMYEEGEIWVTFVHEGAGWKNALGYYTYPTDNPPSSVNDIDDLTIIFPNVSMGNKDEIVSGNKVQLLYLDQNENEYVKLFPAGRSVGWFLVAHGWQDGKREVNNKVYTHYSNTSLNIENSGALRKHNVLLYDGDTERMILGFEDIDRSSPSCDHDFNDAIFYATINPMSAVKPEDYQEVDKEADDEDNDGTPDEFDEYPSDPTKAFNNYYVAEGEFGSLAFEDLWPSKGDFDFNDLVVAYNFNQITNSDNDIVQIDAKLLVKAIGASFKNAFGFALETTPASIESVTGQRITDGYLDISSNGTENGQSKATIICFDDPYNVIDYPGAGSGVNTDPNSPYSTPDTLKMTINFTNPVNGDDLGTPPYNPFIIIDQQRGKEVHLPNHEPTDLADTSLLGQYDDDSNENNGKYYVSDQYLPWAINVPVSFDYPSEKKSILNSYLLFDDWAISNGNSNKDWYMNGSGYRNSSNIYSK